MEVRGGGGGEKAVVKRALNKNWRGENKYLAHSERNKEKNRGGNLSKEQARQ